MVSRITHRTATTPHSHVKPAGRGVPTNGRKNDPSRAGHRFHTLIRTMRRTTAGRPPAAAPPGSGGTAVHGRVVRRCRRPPRPGGPGRAARRIRSAGRRAPDRPRRAGAPTAARHPAPGGLPGTGHGRHEHAPLSVPPHVFLSRGPSRVLRIPDREDSRAGEIPVRSDGAAAGDRLAVMRSSIAFVNLRGSISAWIPVSTTGHARASSAPSPEQLEICVPIRRHPPLPQGETAHLPRHMLHTVNDVRRVDDERLAPR